MSNQMITILVNDSKELQVQQDTFLLKPILAAGIVVPSLCYHKDLTPDGSCRLCVCEIEVKGKRRLVTSCNYPVRDNIKVWTNSEKVQQHRQKLAEMYLGRWPNVKVVQDAAKQCGVTDGSKFRSELTEESDKACILCGKCVRACKEFILCFCYCCSKPPVFIFRKSSWMFSE